MARRKYQFDKGRWEMERERHRVARQKPIPPDTSTGLSEVIPQVMKSLGLEDRFWEQALLEEWTTLVGPQVARHARPGRLERKIFHIFVSSSVWLSELSRYGQKQILENLQKRFGAEKIKGVKLQLDPDAP